MLHRFQERVGVAFPAGGEDEQVDGPVECIRVIGCTGEVRSSVYPELVRQLSQRLVVLAGSGDEEGVIRVRGERCVCFEEEIAAFLAV